MSALLEVVEKLQDTEAALAALNRAALENPSAPSIVLTQSSLMKRRRTLEQQFSHVAALNELDVCNYRLLPETSAANPPILDLANALRHFQTWFTIVYDALKGGPKQRTRVAPEITAETSMHFGYSYSGSIGFILTMPNERLLVGGTDLDKAMESVLEMAKAESSDQIAYFSKQFGPAAIRQMFRWTNDHIAGAMGADIEWRRDATVKARLFAEIPHLENLKKAISETSDEFEETITLRGSLVGLDTARHSFHMKFPDGSEIRGGASEAIGTPSKTVELPVDYTATIRKLTKINYATDSDVVSYFLLLLEPPRPEA
jgi:hypothetical protein